MAFRKFLSIEKQIQEIINQYSSGWELFDEQYVREEDSNLLIVEHTEAEEKLADALGRLSERKLPIDSIYEIADAVRSAYEVGRERKE